MTFVNFFILLALQIVSGFGIVSKLDNSLPRFVLLPLAVLVGSFVGTLAVYLLGAFYLPVNWPIFLLVFLLLTIASAYPFPKTLLAIKSLATSKKLNIKIYELLIAFFVLQVFFISAWRTYYQPVISFDSVCGIDLFAKNAIKDANLFCLIFDVDHLKDLSTQAYYAPYTAFQQIIYRLAGFEVGQVWLAMVFLCFIVFMYHTMKEQVHAAVAGLILYIVITVPEFFAYTFILQTDFSNAVFTLIAVVFLSRFWHSPTGELSKLYMSALFFAIAIWTRSETLFFLPFFTIFVVLKLWPKGFASMAKTTAVFGLLSSFTFALWNLIFYKFYFKKAPSASNVLTVGDYSISNLTTVLKEFNSKVIFAEGYWGYIVYIFIGILVVDIVLFKKIKGYFFLVAIFILWFTFLMLELHFVHFNVENTFRRGFFKLIVIGGFYLSQTEIFSRLTKVIDNFELEKSPVKKV